MKKIKLPVPSGFSLSWDMESVMKALASQESGGKVHLGHLDFGEAGNELDIARDNGAQIVYATMGIQNKLDDIIALYFFGPFKAPNDQRDFFINQVLQSSGLSFAFRKELAHNIIDKRDLLKGEDKKKLQTNLKKIMDWRNAFAHGKLEYDTRLGSQLRYFSGSSKVQCLDDEYWSKVENCFSETISLLEKSVVELSHMPSSETDQQA